MCRKRREELVLDNPGRDLQTCIIVPVRNEEELLPGTLRALAEQKSLCGAPVAYHSYEVILLINNTTDRSRQVAQQFQRLYPDFRLHISERTFRKSNAHVGYVRRLLMDEAARRLETAGHPQAAILSTDADTQVAPNWIAQNLRELHNGADAVGGRIVIPVCEQLHLDPATIDLHRYDHAYRRLICWLEHECDPEPHDPWPRHHQHFGASLAITPRAYRFAGKLPPRRCLEDCAFYSAMMRRDVKIRHSNTVKVFTSARLAGRTRAGLSTQLAAWENCGRNALRAPVENYSFLRRMFTVRGNLRTIWTSVRAGGNAPAHLFEEVGKTLGASQRLLRNTCLEQRYFGALLEEIRFYERCRDGCPEWQRLAPLTDVVEDLMCAFTDERRAQLPTPVSVGRVR